MWRVICCLLPVPAFADALIPNRVIKAGEVIETTDLSVIQADIPGTLSDPARVAGQEARMMLYPGRPIRVDQVGAPTVIARNQVVSLSYIAGSLAISTEGRALDRGSAGDMIRVVNLSSRNTVHGRVMPDGTVRVSPSEG